MSLTSLDPASVSMVVPCQAASQVSPLVAQASELCSKGACLISTQEVGT